MTESQEQTEEATLHSTVLLLLGWTSCLALRSRRTQLWSRWLQLL